MRLPGDLDGFHVWWGPAADQVGEQVGVVNHQVCCGQRGSPLPLWLFFNMLPPEDSSLSPHQTDPGEGPRLFTAVCSVPGTEPGMQ